MPANNLPVDRLAETPLCSHIQYRLAPLLPESGTRWLRNLSTIDLPSNNLLLARLQVNPLNEPPARIGHKSHVPTGTQRKVIISPRRRQSTGHDRGSGVLGNAGDGVDGDFPEDILGAIGEVESAATDPDTVDAERYPLIGDEERVREDSDDSAGGGVDGEDKTRVGIGADESVARCGTGEAIGNPHLGKSGNLSDLGLVPVAACKGDTIECAAVRDWAVDLVSGGDCGYGHVEDIWRCLSDAGQGAGVEAVDKLRIRPLGIGLDEVEFRCGNNKGGQDGAVGANCEILYHGVVRELVYLLDRIEGAAELDVEENKSKDGEVEKAGGY